MAALRTPSLIYTLLLAGAVAWSVQKMTCSWRNACLAACVYLAFFSTFRFGRTFLTSAPESFWLNLPLFCLLWLRLRSPTSITDRGLGWLLHMGFGLALGLGLAYKSFALIAPAATALWCAQLLSIPSLTLRGAILVSVKVGLSAVIALGIFSLWFVLDPDPAAVWQEFVIGENAGKLSSSQGYWQTALFGGGISIWAQLLAYVQNAGLLAFVALGLMGVGVRGVVSRRPPLHPSGRASAGLSPPLLILLSWLAVWLIVFTLPSQRSARYVIPAMPALAMLIALYWSRIGRAWFLASLLLCGVAIGVLGRIAWAANDVGIGTDAELTRTMLAVAVGLILVLAGLRPVWTRACTLAACLGVYACFGLCTAPLNGVDGLYPSPPSSTLKGARIAVPNGFNGQFERFEFLLPGNRFIPYDSEGRAGPRVITPQAQLNNLLAQHDAVIWLQATPSELRPPCAPGCTVLAKRWEVKGRHQSGEINPGNIWYPQAWLFRREWLLAAHATAPTADAQPH